MVEIESRVNREDDPRLNHAELVPIGERRNGDAEMLSGPA